MKTKITLTNPTDDELSGVVAERVAKLPRVGPEWGIGPKYWYKIRDAQGGGNLMNEVPPYATSADAVLPLLAAHTKRTNELRGGEGDTWKIHAPAGDDDDWSVCPIWMHHDGWVEEIGMMGEAPTFPRAACIALLRANGVEVIT